MSDININSANIETTVSSITSKIQTDIMDAVSTSKDSIVNAIENSSGDYIGALKEEVIKEAEIISSVGELLIEMTNYIQLAANAFAFVDQAYDTTKI